MKIYQVKDYVGELNLLALERRIIVRELKNTQRFNKAAELLRCTTRGLDNKLVAHNIQKTEWQK